MRDLEPCAAEIDQVVLVPPVLRRQGEAAVAAEGAGRDLDAGRGLAPLVFVDAKQPRDLFHHLHLKALGHDLGHTPFGHAGEEALAVGGPSEAATHFLDALELIDTSRSPVTDVDAFALARRCAEALIASGRVPKAVKVLRQKAREAGLEF
mgnify:CR=1 FL=1